MNKRTILAVALSIGTVLVLCRIGIFIYEQNARKVYYNTPQESFEKSAPLGAELTDILVKDEFALIIYRKWNGVTTFRVICERDSKWNSMLVEQENVELAKYENYLIDVRHVEDQYVVVLSVVEETGETIQVADNCDTEFSEISCDSSEDLRIRFYMGVLNDEDINGYKLWVNGEEIPIF